MQFYYSKTKILKHLVFFLFMCFFLYRQVNNPAWLYYIVPLLLLSLWGIITMFLKKGPVLVINKYGILDDSKSGYGFIPWDEITLLEVMNTNVGGVLTIEVLDKTKYFDRTSALRRFFVNLIGSHMSIYFMQISPGLKDAWDYLKINHPDKVAEASFEKPRKINTFTWKFVVFNLVILAIITSFVIYFKH